ncbi:MAG: hypothetical protein AAFO79_00320 [Pseudomonadota bacterium]
MSLRIPPAKKERLEAWIASQPVPPRVTDVMLLALDKFLDEAGAPPERSAQGDKQ